MTASTPPTEIDVLPSKRQQFAPAHARRDRQDKEGLQTLSFGCLEKAARLITSGDRRHLDAPNLWSIRPPDKGGHVASQQAVVHGPLERYVKQGVEVMNRSRAEPRGQLLGVKAPEVDWLEPRHGLASDLRRQDVAAYVARVVGDSPRLKGRGA